MKIILKKISLILITLVIITVTGKSQVIGEKLRIAAGYGSLFFPGKGNIDDGVFSMPSFYRNLGRGSGFSLKMMYELSPNLSAGLRTDCLSSRTWSLEGSDLFKDAGTQLLSATPLVGFHTKHLNYGLMNRLRCFIEAGPLAGLSKVEQVNPLLNTQPESGGVIKPLRGSDFSFGISASAGFDFSVSQWTGFTISTGMTRQWINSELYADRNFICESFTFGLYVKLLHDKRFFLN